MSDFDNTAWSIFVAAVTLLGLVACLVLLFVASRTKVVQDDNTTGHVWDGDLREMNNPLPMWWVGLFVISVIFSLAYLVVYPGLGSYAGTFGWSSEQQHQEETQAHLATMAPVYARYAALDETALARDPAAMGIGERLFLNQCATCHGSDGRGSKGFPNLADNDWLHGGSLDKIKETILAGRVGVMPPMAAAVGTPEDQRNLAHYVLSLSGSAHDSVAAALGKSKFGACAACHGPQGLGNQALGAPNLADKIWLHGYGEQAIVRMVAQGKNNVMPAQSARLTPEQIHVLAAYVKQLSAQAGAAAR